MRNSQQYPRPLIKTIVVLCTCCPWSLAPLTLLAQDQPARPITAVEFRGATEGGERLARNLVGISAGTPLDPASLDAAVSRLLRSGRFIDARYLIEEADAGWRVVFELRERVIVTAIRFEGNVSIKEKELLKHVVQTLNAPVDWFAARDGRDAIETQYRAEGFPTSSVRFDRARLERTGELVYTIQEGAKLVIRRIAFEGNDSFTDPDLRLQIDSKKKFWIIRSGAYDQERAETDVIRLRAYYRDQGFLDARVRHRVEPNLEGKDQALVFTIDEGTRYAIEAIDFRGHRIFTQEQLLAMMTSRVGEFVIRPRVDADVTAIRTRYGELGYIYIGARATQIFSNTPGFVRITIDVTEGQQFRVGRVVVRGNKRTQDKVVRRALNLFPPDDLFDMTEVAEAKRRLSETQIFSQTRIYPVGDTPGIRDVIIDVEEAEKSGDFIFGAGITSNSGLVGNIVLDMKNFDLSDKPRSWKELYKLRSFFGGGQRLRLELQPGTEVSRFRIDFTEPYLNDKPMRLDVSAYLFQRNRDGYDEKRGGASVSFGKRFERGRLRGWSGEIAFRAETVKIEDLDIFVAKEVREDEGSNLVLSVKGSLARDRTDNRLVPTSGDRLRLSYEQFYGDEVYGKARAGYTRYKTISTDYRGRKRVLQLRIEGGVIAGNAPIYNRFYAGGTGSIRGFDFRGVGERNGLDDTNIGGDYMVLAGAEYTVPLVGERVRGLIFLDTGVVGSGPLRAAVGIGIRLTLNLLGPVPLEFTIAAPLSKDEDDETQAFAFQIGKIF